MILKNKQTKQTTKQTKQSKQQKKKKKKNSNLQIILQQLINNNIYIFLLEKIDLTIYKLFFFFFFPFLNNNISFISNFYIYQYTIVCAYAFFI
ncbi:hypothetical protein U3516DRAFT_390025 [Neocallimastix sp. 'constans']